jgi:hypothetical protein
VRGLENKMPRRICGPKRDEMKMQMCNYGPPSFLSNGYGRALFPGAKLLERESNHSPQSTVEFKNVWTVITTSSTPLLGAFTQGQGKGKGKAKVIFPSA